MLRYRHPALRAELQSAPDSEFGEGACDRRRVQCVRNIRSARRGSSMGRTPAALRRGERRLVATAALVYQSFGVGWPSASNFAEDPHAELGATVRQHRLDELLDRLMIRRLRCLVRHRTRVRFGRRRPPSEKRTFTHPARACARGGASKCGVCGSARARAREGPSTHILCLASAAAAVGP